ncbi:uncharacterized protein FIBRA_02986 [Fibroporia radiculosa]|uniref:Uncharacterized protein n=1 Tax=Fibroporia radiculosa TaxID=599839 RepID=J4H256_9APHY|nr:uncharacterized protein FIBRA_02986 [Fibroporia radiculosa]CCM00939.1 predicted protein [Fibroporia radiculosa]
MATLAMGVSNHSRDGPPPAQDAAIDDLSEAVVNATLQDSDTADNSSNKSTANPPRLLCVYTRAQILYLRKSPLVQPPNGMPSLKDWFGDWNEQQTSTKKDADVSNGSTNARERRFRRDVEDGDSSRPSFRSTLSQPSQMGNFRHQSIRTSERERDRDSERERERDLRDKEGQERLRNLSDKYDRDRLALSSASNGLRSKDRDSAPHLVSGTSSRLGQNSATSARRNDARDAVKRKAGETSDDWRRGPDNSRAGRDDKPDSSRRDRDRPRSRVRDSSRTRRDPSSSRRDRERDRDERDRDRDRVRDRRGDTDRDEHRRDKDDYLRRERDDHHRREWDDSHNRSERDRDDTYQRDNRDKFRAKDPERDHDDDPRRWRDDGKRDERMAIRRERERERWDKGDDRDRERPGTSDDRDTRPRRGIGRERRGDDGRERDRAREAEPAWMETYVPSTSGGGILGGKTSDGELDGIQAWKKGMKEKERQEKESESTSKASEADKSSPTSNQPLLPSAAPDSQLDEIQLFKLMMKREAARKDGETDIAASAGSTPTQAENDTSNPELEHVKDVPEKDNRSSSPLRSTQRDITATTQSPLDSLNQLPNHAAQPNPQLTKATAVSTNGVQSLLTLISTASGESASAKLPATSVDQASEGSRLLGSRVTSNSLPPASAASLTQVSEMSIESSNASPTSAFNPPPGSRLLAFGSRVSSAGSVGPDVLLTKSLSDLDSVPGQLPPPGIHGLPGHKLASIPSNSTHPALSRDGMSGLGVDPHFASNSRHLGGDTSRVMGGFSSHGNLTQSSLSYDELPDTVSLGQLNELRRPSAVERAAFGLSPESASAYSDVGNAHPGATSMSSNGSIDLAGANVPGGVNYATGKGSRFAKFFDSKARENQAGGGRKAPGLSSYPSSAALPDPRHTPVSMNGMINNGETRTMEDIFAMLQNSAQSHRGSPQIPPTGRVPSGSSPFGQNHSELHNLQNQMHAQQHFPQNPHLESLYDSRFEDRNFVPDGMVPGLRPPIPRSRSREPSGVLFNEQLDDPLHFNVRLQQQRNLDQMYSGPASSVYAQQQAAMLRNGGMPLQQQPQFRGAPSPIANQNAFGGPSQRLPPGLANLGGRPPHDPSQFIGGQMGGMGSGLQGGLHGGSPVQHSLNNFGGGGGLGFGGGPQARGLTGPQNPLGLASMGGMGHQHNLDLRAANQAQLLGLGGGVGMRGQGQGPGFGPGHGPSGQVPGAHLGMRQQQPQQLPPHLMPHLLPPHLQQQQQQQGMLGGSAQGTQDLMALLMGGHRD